MAAAYRCTAEYPWTNEKGPVLHVEAHEVGEQRDGYPGGDTVTMYCPNCGHKWEKELAQLSPQSRGVEQGHRRDRWTT